MKEKKFLNNYFNTLRNLISFNNKDIEKLIKVKKIFETLKKTKKKILVFGNGGSAAIASHFSVDITKNAKIKCSNYNESDLITCFSNDFGYENWIKKALDYYAFKDDIMILVSSSGRSKNIINAAKFAKKRRIKLITLSGLNSKNPLKKIGDINFFVNSKNYNVVETTHLTILLAIVENIISQK